MEICNRFAEVDKLDFGGFRDRSIERIIVRDVLLTLRFILPRALVSGSRSLALAHHMRPWRIEEVEIGMCPAASTLRSNSLYMNLSSMRDPERLTMGDGSAVTREAQSSSTTCMYMKDDCIRLSLALVLRHFLCSCQHFQSVSQSKYLAINLSSSLEHYLQRWQLLQRLS